MIDHFFGLAKSNWLSTQKRSMMVFLVYVQPFFLLAMYHFANPYLADPSKSFWFIVINVSIVNAWSIYVFSTASDTYRDRWTGMLAIIIASPTSLLTIFMVKAMSNMLHAMCSLLIITVLAYLFYRPEFGDILIAKNWGILLGLFVIIALFSLCFSVILAMSPVSGLIMNFIEYPIFVLGGIGFSIGLLPVFMQKFAFLFPFSFLMEYLRIETGLSLIMEDQLEQALTINIVGSLLTLVVGVSLFILMQKRLETKGTLL